MPAPLMAQLNLLALSQTPCQHHCLWLPCDSKLCVASRSKKQVTPPDTPEYCQKTSLLSLQELPGCCWVPLHRSLDATQGSLALTASKWQGWQSMGPSLPVLCLLLHREVLDAAQFAGAHAPPQVPAAEPESSAVLAFASHAARNSA